jgi:hypothetical protein
MVIDEVSVGGAGDFYLYQKNYDQVTGSTLGEKLDGWINLNSQLNSRTISWRYPWQNYPNGIAVNNHKAQIELYSLEKSSIFSPNEIAATTEIASFTSEIWDIPTGTFGGIQLSPAGVSKTYELSVWEGQQVLPKVANQLLQNPVYAYIDPNFAVQSDFPHPMTSKTDNSILEGALSSAFDWVSNIRDPASRYGFWNFGEVPYDWRKKNMGSPTYRYWANHGTSWGTSAWSLWMRSGERKYIVNGETHARHAMDLDICKVPNWLPDNSKKRRGGLNVYSPLPGSYVGGRVVGKVGGYEYLSYIFYLTNYDRAFDITNLITESLIKFDHNEYLEPIIQNPLLANREFYRPLADIVTSYEATLNENLKNIAFQYLDLIELAQNDSGWFPGIKSPHYLTAGLNLAYRALPERKVQIQSILEKMITYRGNSLHPAKSGNVEGSFSLFSYYHLAKENMNTDLEDFISKRARSQYSGLYQLNNEWNGISAFPRFKYEFLIQDWLMSSKIMEEKGNDQTFLPASHVNGNLNGVSKHISYFKLEKNNLVNLDFSLHFQLSAGINQNHNIVMKVYNPKGALIHQKNYYVVPPVYQNPGIQFFKDQIQNITTTGVYKIEFELPAKPVGVNIQMNHKLVHEINPESFYIISVSEGAGSFYAKVLNNSTASVEVDYSSYSGKNLVRDMNQNILCESILFNILENAVEQSQICEFTNNGVEPVEILTNVSRLDNDTKLTNFYPYISLHPDQWFDPNE